MDIFEQYEKQRQSVEDDRLIRAEKLRVKFVEDYPINKINEIQIVDYLTGLEQDDDNRQTFCRRLRYELQCVCSMGDCFPDVFGIYFVKSSKKTAIAKEFDTSPGKPLTREKIESVFRFIKQQIVTFLRACRSDNFEDIEKAVVNSKLDRLFVHKLLAVYYPEKCIPVVTEDTLREYCFRVGLAYNESKPPVYNNYALLNWKNARPECADWSNARFMQFCVWLCHTQKKLDGSIEAYEKAGSSKSKPKTPSKRATTEISTKLSHFKTGNYGAWTVNKDLCWLQTNDGFAEKTQIDIPDDVAGFFCSDGIIPGKTLSYIFEYENKPFDVQCIFDGIAYSINCPSDLFNRLIDEFDLSSNYPYLVFQRNEKGIFSLKFFAGKEPKDAAPLDDTHTEEEQEAHAFSMTDAALRHAAESQSTSTPVKYETTTTAYKRGGYVKGEVKRIANGVCQLCGEEAPFLDKNNQPYLEVHHVIWLANGGPDSIDNAVALCPNCHKKMHILNDPEDVSFLSEIAKNQ